MILKLYLANFPPEAAEEQIQSLFESVGQVSRIKVIENSNAEHIGGRALLWLETEQETGAVLAQINGRQLDGYRLCLSPNKPFVTPEEPTAEQRQFAEAVAAQLGETDPEPCQQILDIIRLCGTAFAQAVLDDTLDVEAQGGMQVRDGSRQRTRGGIFFYLARGRLSIGLQQVIVPQLRKQLAAQPKPQPKAKPNHGKKKEQPSKTSQPRFDSGPAVTPPPKPLSEEEMTVIRQTLIDLQCERATAQSILDQLRAQPPDKQSGTFSAIKRVLDFQRQIDLLLKEYPFLKSS